MGELVEAVFPALTLIEQTEYKEINKLGSKRIEAVGSSFLTVTSREKQSNNGDDKPCRESLFECPERSDLHYWLCRRMALTC